MGWVLSCETGFSEVPIHFVDEKATPSHAKTGEGEMGLAQSETPCTWRRPLYGTWEISSVSGMAGRAGS
jgi:hypothetical protein